MGVSIIGFLIRGLQAASKSEFVLQKGRFHFPDLKLHYLLPCFFSKAFPYRTIEHYLKYLWLIKLDHPHRKWSNRSIGKDEWMEMQ
ncbi:hypothetical protein L2E82_51910 [Cichorium intybus]|nr:hypothetical protein L2E82_51910 [Cichorium intybus]